MKNFITLIAITLCLVSFGQKEYTISLDWKDTALLFSENTPIDIPHFQPEYFGYQLGADEIFFHFSIPTTTETDFIIENITYETITKEQLGRLSENKLPTTINKSVTSSNSRDRR